MLRIQARMRAGIHYWSLYLGDGEKLGYVEDTGEDDGRDTVLEEQERFSLATQPATHQKRIEE